MANSNSNSNKPYLGEEIPLSFDPTVFDSAKLTIDIQNTTTNTEVKKGSQIELIELHERGAMLQIPSRSCSRGHNLMVRFRTETPKKEIFEFTTTAKVDSTTPQDGGEFDQVNLSFLQYDEESWELFQKYFTARQEEIIDFLRAAKGY